MKQQNSENFEHQKSGRFLKQFNNKMVKLEYYCRLLIYSIGLLMLMIFMFKFINNAWTLMAWIIMLLALLIMHVDTHIILYNKMSSYKNYNSLNSMMETYNKWIRRYK